MRENNQNIPMRMKSTRVMWKPMKADDIYQLKTVRK